MVSQVRRMTPVFRQQSKHSILRSIGQVLAFPCFFHENLSMSCLMQNPVGHKNKIPAMQRGRYQQSELPSEKAGYVSGMKGASPRVTHPSFWS
jgi:hypothetical protein